MDDPLSDWPVFKISARLKSIVPNLSAAYSTIFIFNDSKFTPATSIYSSKWYAVLDVRAVAPSHDHQQYIREFKVRKFLICFEIVVLLIFYIRFYFTCTVSSAPFAFSPRWTVFFFFWNTESLYLHKLIFLVSSLTASNKSDCSNRI